MVRDCESPKHLEHQRLKAVVLMNRMHINVLVFNSSMVALRIHWKKGKPCLSTLCLDFCAEGVLAGSLFVAHLMASKGLFLKLLNSFIYSCVYLFFNLCLIFPPELVPKVVHGMAIMKILRHNIEMHLNKL